MGPFASTDPFFAGTQSVTSPRSHVLPFALLGTTPWRVDAPLNRGARDD
jgi:hypothetical protein